MGYLPDNALDALLSCFAPFSWNVTKPAAVKAPRPRARFPSYAFADLSIAMAVKIEPPTAHQIDVFRLHAALRISAEAVFSLCVIESTGTLIKS